MPKIYLKPATPDLIVRDPYTKLPLPKDGKLVQMDSYWLRRIQTGDVVVVIHKAQSSGPTVGDITLQVDQTEGDE